MLIRILLFGSLIFATTMTNLTAAEEFPEPVEYVLGDNFNVVPRAEFEEPFVEEIEVRGVGERSDRWITGVKQASLTLYLPNGAPTAAAIVCPGGGYGGLSFDKEGVYVAKWLRERGMAAGVLKSSVHTGEPLGSQPLAEALYAIRFMKQKVGGKLGVVGFSAGGHLAASAANHVPRPDVDATGLLEAYDSRLAFHALVYPVISMRRELTHGGSRNHLLGPSPTEEAVQQMSMEQQVTAATPPSFLVHTADDSAVSFENSIQYFQACLANGVSAELHVYPSGGHGYGMWQDEGTIAEWPAAFEAWLRSLKLIK